MKITELHLYRVSLTSHETYYMADDKTCDSVDSMVLSVHTDTDITMATALHLATATPSNRLLKVCDLSGYVAPRLDAGGPTRNNGFIQVSEQPRHGISPDPTVLGKPILSLGN